MNDASELIYAVNTIADTLVDFFERTKNPELRETLTRRSMWEYFDATMRPFIACFCEKDDLLSQWRGYVPGLLGVALGLDVAAAVRHGNLPPGTILRKVIYSKEEQKRLIEEKAAPWLEAMEAAFESREESWLPGELRDMPWSLRDELTEYQLRFKHTSFQEEQEWRLITLVDVWAHLSEVDRRRNVQRSSNSQNLFGVYRFNPGPEPSDDDGLEIKFRPSNLGMIPYFEMPLKLNIGVFSGRLPLQQVMQGPGPHSDLSRSALEAYLRSLGYGFPFTQIKLSEIPLR